MSDQVPCREGTEDASDASKTFEQVWAEGDVALCNVRFGWNLAMEQLAAAKGWEEENTDLKIANNLLENAVIDLRARVAELESKLPRKLSDEDDSSVEPFV